MDIQLLLITFFVLVLAIAGMAIGVILSNRKLKGSCGGLGAVMGEDCMFCENKDKCEKKNKHSSHVPLTTS